VSHYRREVKVISTPFVRSEDRHLFREGRSESLATPDCALNCTCSMFGCHIVERITTYRGGARLLSAVKMTLRFKMVTAHISVLMLKIL